MAKAWSIGTTWPVECGALLRILGVGHPPQLRAAGGAVRLAGEIVAGLADGVRHRAGNCRRQFLAAGLDRVRDGGKGGIGGAPAQRVGGPGV